MITVNNKAILTNLANAAAASSGGSGRPTISVIGGPSSTAAGGTASALAHLQLPKVITPKKQIVTNVSIVNGRVQDAVGTVPSLVQSEASNLAASVLATSTRPLATAKTLDLLKPLDGKTASQMVETPSGLDNDVISFCLIFEIKNIDLPLEGKIILPLIGADTFLFRSFQQLVNSARRALDP